jgi:hypothetical protein
MLRSWRVAVESNGRGSSADRRGERTEARGAGRVVFSTRILLGAVVEEDALGTVGWGSIVVQCSTG